MEEKEYNSQMEFSIEQPKKRFEHHLAVPFNERIIFSAPFGSGKTYFLQKYFEENVEYEAIHLFPVNYSVASNEDIFELVKYDILYELLRKNVAFKQLEIPHIEILLDFAKKNAHHILAPFINLIPIIGKSAYTVYDKLETLSEEYLSKHDEQQVDDLKSILNYLDGFAQNPGSVYEQDFYTELIRQLVGQLKESKGEKRETVLIIDDLDRIDPEHLFRILNVLSAHLDRKETGNKFGFDKVIVVFDQKNVHKIFQNRYGSDVDFSGYIDKFYSHKIFEFANEIGLAEQINSVLSSVQKTYRDKSLDFHDPSKPFTKNLVYILTVLIRSQKLTVRRLKKVLGLKFPQKSYPSGLTGGRELYKNFNLEIYVLIEFLLMIYGSLEEVILVLEECAEMDDDSLLRDDRKNFIGFALVVLDSDNHQMNPKIPKTMLDHQNTEQLISYNTREFHENHDGFFCNVIEIKDLKDATKTPSKIKYLPILIDTVKFMRSNNLIQIN